MAAAALGVLAVLGGVLVATDTISIGNSDDAGAALSATTDSDQLVSPAVENMTVLETPSASASAKAAKKKALEKAAAGVDGKNKTATVKATPKESDEADETTTTVSTGDADSVKLGVFRGTYPSKVKSFGTWLGRDVDYAMDFSTRSSWDEIANPTWMLSEWQGTGYRMVYAVAMLPTGDDSATFSAGAKGEYDQYFETLAKNLVKYDQGDSIIRLGWEFNLSASRWHPDTQANFIGYWRHIVDAMRSVSGGENLKFDFNPNIGGETYDSTKYYPGNAYVDYIGVDTYDISWLDDTYPYPSSCDSSCKRSRQKTAWEGTLNGTFGLKFWANFAKSKGKPMSLPEWGMWDRPDGHGGGDNSYYIQQMISFIGDPDNNIGYQSYFEFDVGDTGDHALATLTSGGAMYRRLLG